MNRVPYLITAAVFAFFGLILKFALSGYSFMAYLSFGVAAAAIFFLVLRLLSGKYPKTTRILNKIAVYAIIIFAFALAVTLTMLVSDGAEEDNSGADYAIVLGAGVNGTVPSASLAARCRGQPGNGDHSLRRAGQRRKYIRGSVYV